MFTNKSIISPIENCFIMLYLNKDRWYFKFQKMVQTQHLAVSTNHTARLKKPQHRYNATYKSWL